MAAGADKGYAQTFDSKWYLKKHYSKVFDDDGTKKFSLDALHDIFKTGKIKGDTLLDIGTGPTISNIIVPSCHFNHVYLSDFTEENRKTLSQWCTDPSHHDYSDFFKYAVGKYENGQTWEQLQGEVLRKIRGVLFCDVRDSSPLKPCFFPQFDAMTTTFCLHVVSHTIDEYSLIVKNVSSLLKPGGWFIKLGHLEETHYEVNEVRFNVTYLTKEDIYKVWTENGFDIEIWRELRPAPEVRNKTADYQGLFVMAARKKEENILHEHNCSS